MKKVNKLLLLAIILCLFANMLGCAQRNVDVEKTKK
jgi:hypothetical protein